MKIKYWKSYERFLVCTNVSSHLCPINVFRYKKEDIWAVEFSIIRDLNSIINSTEDVLTFAKNKKGSFIFKRLFPWSGFFSGKYLNLIQHLHNAYTISAHVYCIAMLILPVQVPAAAGLSYLFYHCSHHISTASTTT